MDIDIHADNVIVVAVEVVFTVVVVVVGIAAVVIVVFVDIDLNVAIDSEIGFLLVASAHRFGVGAFAKPKEDDTSLEAKRAAGPTAESLRSNGRLSLYTLM